MRVHYRKNNGLICAQDQTLLPANTWFTYSDRVKAVLRLVACAKHGGTPLHKLCEQSNFDVKLRWMIGLPADMEGISVVEADRAMVRGL